MTDPVAPHAADTLPPALVNGSAPPVQPAPPAPPVETPPRHRGRGTKISGVRTGLIAGFVVLVVVLIFIIQNGHTVTIDFFGAHAHVPLAVALLLAVVAGALLMAAAGTARITQLRHVMRRDRRKTSAR
jgi:lipopolysaccharide assembly protein A